MVDFSILAYETIMRKRTEFKEAISLFAECGFFDDLTEDGFDYWRGFGAEVHPGYVKVIDQKFSFSAGASKICVSHDCFGEWMLKVGYIGLSRDYAQCEYDNFVQAVQYGLEEFFPTTLFLGEFYGSKFYLQQKAAVNAGNNYSRLTNAIQARVDEEELEEGYDGDIGFYIDDLTEEDVISFLFDNEKLTDFIIEQDINDLHMGNFGIIDGRMVIIDFSGWRS